MEILQDKDGITLILESYTETDIELIKAEHIEHNNRAIRDCESQIQILKDYNKLIKDFTILEHKTMKSSFGGIKTTYFLKKPQL